MFSPFDNPYIIARNHFGLLGPNADDIIDDITPTLPPMWREDKHTVKRGKHWRKFASNFTPPKKNNKKRKKG